MPTKLEAVGELLSMEQVTLACGACSADFDFARYKRGKQQIGADPAVCPKCQGEADRHAANADMSLFGPQRPRRTATCDRCGRQHDGTVASRMCEVGANPWMFGSASFATVEAWPGREKMFRAAQQWAGRVLGRTNEYAPAENLLVWGEHGLAKTLVAHCALVALLEANTSLRIVFVDWPRWMMRVQDTYNAGKETSPMVDALHFADVVFLDDVFSGKVTPDVLEKLNLVLNGREGRWSFITTNPDPETIQGRWGALTDDVPRLVSRLGRFRVSNPTGDEDGRFAPAPPRVPAGTT